MQVAFDSKQQLKDMGMIFDDPKGFHDHFMESFTTNFKNKKISDLITLDINGNKAVQTEITAKLNDVKLYYLITII